ncbi:hypothetical protein BBJ28_00026121 [Nothophytophthora sp. Chile5]|nr:hypothetical protein BBJ28_00026121 [Nothophytophthora sp. Chile5]
MPLPTLEALGLACLAIIVFLFVRAHRRAVAADSDSSDDESSGPLSVSVVTSHEESDSLLPKFAGLLRSPWHRGAGEDGQKAPKMMQPVQKVVRKMSLTMPLPLRKKRKPEVLTKKYHAPYFFPLLDETAQWWQAQQAVPEPQPPPSPRPRPITENDLSAIPSCQGSQEAAQAPQLASNERCDLQSLCHSPTTTSEVTATPTTVGGR